MKKFYLVLFVVLFAFYNSLSFGNEFQDVKASRITVANYDFISKDAWLPKFSPDNKLLFYYDVKKDKGIIIDATTYKKKFDFVFKRTSKNKGFFAERFKTMAWHPDGEKIIYLTSEGNIIVVDLKENKQIKLPISDHHSYKIKWRSDSEIYFLRSNYLSILNLENLTKTEKRLSKEERINPFGLNSKLKNRNLYIDRINHNNISINNSDNSYGRILIKDVSSDSVHPYDVTSNLKKIAFFIVNRGLYIATLGLREEPQMVFSITLDKKTQLTPKQRNEFEKYYKGGTIDGYFDKPQKFVIKGKVFAPSINPLNKKVIGPDRNHFKGYVKFTKSGDVNSTVETSFEFELIGKGDVVADIHSNYINGRKLGKLHQVWAILE